MNKIVILVVLALVVGLSGGYLLGVSRGAVPAPTAVVALPSPSPEAKSEFNNDKAEVKFADGKKFTYLQDGKEKTLTDLTGITVWKSSKPSDKPEKVDWKILKVGDKVQLASEKATGKIVAVLVL